MDTTALAIMLGFVGKLPDGAADSAAAAETAAEAAQTAAESVVTATVAEIKEYLGI